MAKGPSAGTFRRRERSESSSAMGSWSAASTSGSSCETWTGSSGGCSAKRREEGGARDEGQDHRDIQEGGAGSAGEDHSRIAASARLQGGHRREGGEDPGAFAAQNVEGAAREEGQGDVREAPRASDHR